MRISSGKRIVKATFKFDGRFLWKAGDIHVVSFRIILELII